MFVDEVVEVHVLCFGNRLEPLCELQLVFVLVKGLKRSVLKVSEFVLAYYLLKINLSKQLESFIVVFWLLSHVVVCISKHVNAMSSSTFFEQRSYHIHISLLIH